MSTLIGEVSRRRELLGLLVYRNLKIRYKGTVLGFLWSLMTPLLMIMIYAVFAGIMRWNTGRPDFLQFLVVGIVIWQFLATCLNDSLHTISGNSNLVKKTAFPRCILPLAMVLANLANFLLTGGVLLIFLLITRTEFSHLIYLPLIIASQCALCMGMALLISSSNVFFRDTEHILGIGTLAWFFLSPVFYSVQLQLDRIPDHLEWLAFLNPITGLLCAYRSVLMADVFPHLAYIVVSLIVSWLVLVVGVIVFQALQVRFADEL